MANDNQSTTIGILVALVVILLLAGGVWAYTQANLNGGAYSFSSSYGSEYSSDEYSSLSMSGGYSSESYSEETSTGATSSQTLLPLSAADQLKVRTYIEDNIRSFATSQPAPGKSFYVTNVQFNAPNGAIVTYTDDQTTIRASMTAEVSNGTVHVASFQEIGM